ncbi:MAG: peptidoglycan-binding protein [Planctomycetota bacterium]|nr:peptidoglycan-binding protein [Planctomycetota bacterium]
MRCTTAFFSILLLPALGSVALAQPTNPGIAGAIDGRAPSSLRGTRFESSAAIADLVRSGGTLTQGASGEQVRAIQSALAAMSFLVPGTPEGRYEVLTARAVKNFQQHAVTAFPDVRATGDVDPATLRALAVLAPAAGERGQRGNTPSNVHEGQRVRVVVVKKEHRTFVFDDQGRVTHIFVNATGAASSPTRSALKFVDAKLGKADCEALGRRLWGNGTVFGERLVGLSGGGQELHGTNAPQMLGLDVSKGCVRHHNPDMLVLYDLVRLNDKVAIVDRADDAKLGARAPVADR